MKKETILEMLCHMATPLQAFSYLNQLLYLFTLLVLKTTVDTLKDKQKAYQKRYHEKPAQIERLLKLQPIYIQRKWEEIYEKVKYPEFSYYLNQLLQEIEETNPFLKGIFSHIDFSNLSYESLRNLIEELNQTNLAIQNEKDQKELEAAIEEMLFTLKQEGGNQKILAGNDFTPREVSRLMARLIAVRANETVADLACGSGGLLLETIKKVGKERVQIYGQEKEKQIYQFCRINLLLHGNYDGDIKQADTIEQNLVNRKFDVIVANPPFSIPNKVKDNMQGENPYLYHNKYPYGIPPASKGDYAFIQSMIQSLKPKGRMITVIGLGALSRKGAEQTIRTNMINDNIIESIILLPANLFRNTAIKTCLMVCRKDKIQTDILFLDASQEFEKGKLQNYFSKQNINDILTYYRQRKNIPGVSYLASLQEVLENDANLSVTKYVIGTKAETIDIKQVERNIKDREEQLQMLKKEKDRLASQL